MSWASSLQQFFLEKYLSIFFLTLMTLSRKIYKLSWYKKARWITLNSVQNCLNCHFELGNDWYTKIAIWCGYGSVSNLIIKIQFRFHKLFALWLSINSCFFKVFDMRFGVVVWGAVCGYIKNSWLWLVVRSHP